MLAYLRTKIKHSLRLHLPLWVALALAILALMLPQSIGSDIWVGTFFGYFIFRFLWRRYLKKKNKLEEGFDLLTLIFWGACGLFILFAVMRPEKIEWVVYAPDAEPQISNDDERKGRRKKKRTDFLSRFVSKVEARGFSCGYARQEELFEECEEVETVELDNNPETMEIMTLSHKAEECETIDCQVWLFQVSPEYLAAYDARMEQEKEKRGPLILEASVIANWQGVLLPLEVQANEYAGWRIIKVNHKNGESERWQLPGTLK